MTVPLLMLLGGALVAVAIFGSIELYHEFKKPKPKPVPQYDATDMEAQMVTFKSPRTFTFPIVNERMDLTDFIPAGTPLKLDNNGKIPVAKLATNKRGKSGKKNQKR